MRVACRRIELAEKVKTAGDLGRITLIRANLRIPESVAIAIEGSQAVINAAGIPFERGRQRYHAVHVGGARAIAEAARAAGVGRLVHVSGIGADSRSSKNRYVRSKVEAEEAIVAAFESATILRPSVVFGPDDVLFNRLGKVAAMAPFMPVVATAGPRSSRCSWATSPGRRGRAGAARHGARGVRAGRPPGLYLPRDRRPHPARDRRDKPIIGVPAGLMKIAGLFAEFPALLGLAPQLTRDQVDLLAHDNVVRAGALTLADLGIVPTAAEIILPTYLDRFRVGGRYNQHAPA